MNKYQAIDAIKTLESLLHKECTINDSTPINRLGFTPKQEDEIKNKILELIKQL